MTEYIGHKIKKGMVWTLIRQIILRPASFVANIILARLLFPEDFGIFAMAVSISSFVQVFGNLGITSFLIYTQENIEENADAAFWMSFLLGFALFLVQSAIAPFIARFFGAPVITKLMVVSALGYIISPLYNIPTAILRKNLEFKKNNLIEIVSNLSTLIMSILFAYNKFGVWSFVLGDLTSRPLTIYVVFKVSSWRPSFNLRLQYWKKVFDFGKHVLGTTIMYELKTQSTNIITGRLAGAKMLGFYNFAYNKITFATTEVAYLLATLIFPSLSKLQKSDKELSELYIKSTRLSVILAYPIIFGLFIVAHEFVEVLYGSKWIFTVPLIKIMLVGIFVQVSVYMGGTLCMAIGRPDIPFKFNIVVAVSNVIIMYFAVKYYGIIGAALAFTIVYAISYPIFIWLIFSIKKWKLKNIINPLIPAFLCSLAMNVLLFFLKNNVLNKLYFPQYLNLIILVSAGAVFYISTLLIMFKDVRISVKEFLADLSKGKFA